MTFVNILWSFDNTCDVVLTCEWESVWRKWWVIIDTGDLNAGDITMSDDDRIQLMILVKEGKLSMHSAVEAVNYFILLSGLLPGHPL